MGLAALLEKRSTPRKKLTGLFPGKLTSKKDNTFLNAKPVDISEHGLGIITSVYLEVDDLLLLKTHNDEIELRVTWRKKDFEKSDLYRYGLSVDDKKINIESIFQNSGCLK